MISYTHDVGMFVALLIYHFTSSALLILLTHMLRTHRTAYHARSMLTHLPRYAPGSVLLELSPCHYNARTIIRNIVYIP